MPRKPSSSAGSLGAHVRKRRLESGLSAADLAAKLGMSRSYLSLIENGDRDVGEKLARKIARALGDQPDLYVEWAREEAARPRTADDGESMLESFARNELRRRSDVPGALNVEVKVAKPSSVSHGRGRTAGDESITLAVPVVEEGTLPDPLPRGDDARYVRIDRAVLPAGERLDRPFAWEIASQGAALAPDILEPGDTVVVTQDPGDIVADELYAVKLDEGAVLLARVQIKDQVLLVMQPDGSVYKALHAGRRAVTSRIAGKVVVVIRPWRYTVLMPKLKR